MRKRVQVHRGYKIPKLKTAGGSWARAFGIALVSLTVLTVLSATINSIALFYLYSFDRDPKKWTNLSVFYVRPKESFVAGMAAKPIPLGSLVVRGSNGNPVYANQYDLSLADLKSSALYHCLLAAEDKRFYRHTGLDYLSVAKALYDHFFKGERLRGASTLSNQLMRTVILADQSRSGFRGLLRKVAEIALTDTAERHFSKDDLLLAYVNNVTVGHRDGRALVGLSAASEALFGKKAPKTLTLSEACTLAGMLNQPNRYLSDALRGDYRRVKDRRDVLLERLIRAFPDRYRRQLIQKTKMEGVRFLKVDNKPNFESRRLMNYAHRQLGGTKPGQRIYLTVDQNLQQSAISAVSEELDRFDRGQYGFYNQLSYRHAVKQGARVAEEDAKLQAALIALDAKTGEILAMVGGRNSKRNELNRATQAKRPPASAIKPFIYLYGIQSGFLDGGPFRADTIIDPSKTPVAPRYTTAGAARARVQLARSDNGAAVALAHEFGLARLKEFIAKILGNNPAATEMLAIGAGKGSEVSPLQLASSYTIFANNGVKVLPKPFWAIYEHEDRLKISDDKPVRLVDAGAAFIVTQMLRSTIGNGQDGQYGTAKIVRKLSALKSADLAGKTGTGDNDLWFVGFTPKLIVVVWVGFDNNFPGFEVSRGFTGSGMPLQIWATFMRTVKKHRPTLVTGNFEMPSTVRELTIDPDHSCTAQAGIKEYFLSNRLPAICKGSNTGF